MINITDWNSQQFSGEYDFVYDGQIHIEVPCFSVDGLTQMDPGGPYIRYLLFDGPDCQRVVARATTSPDDEFLEFMPGINDEVYNLLKRKNVFSGDEIDKQADGGITYIGYEIWMNEPDQGGDAVRDGNYTYDPETGIVDGTPVPFNIIISPSRPNIDIIGNEYSFDWDGEEHIVQGYDFNIEGDGEILLKDLLSQNLCQIIPARDSEDVKVTNYLDGQDLGPGTYTTNFTPESFQLGATYEYENDWKNFSPIFTIRRQVTLIITEEGGGGTSSVNIPVSSSKYYDGTPLMPVVQVPESALVEYSSDGNTFQRNPIGITNAGNVYVTARITIPGKEARYAYYDLQVLPRPIIISSKSASKLYDGLPLQKDEVEIQGVDDNTMTPVPGHPRTYRIKLISRAHDYDFVDIEFNGNQTESGTSLNTFDFSLGNYGGTLIANNYSITANFGQLRVNLNTDQIYVCIAGGSLITEYNGESQSVSGYRIEHIITNQDPTQEIDPNDIIVEDPETGFMSFNVDDRIYVDYSSIYIPRFVSCNINPFLSAVDINEIRNPSDPDYYTPVIYTSNLSENNFQNVNNRFSDTTIHFIVIPNQLLINPLKTTVSIVGNSEEYLFEISLSKSLNDNSIDYQPMWRQVEGCSYYINNDIYSDEYILYSEEYEDPITHIISNISKPKVKACFVNRGNDFDREDPNTWALYQPWLMNIDIENFTNINKNFDVSFTLLEDGQLNIIPKPTTIGIKGYNETVVYDGNSHIIEDVNGDRKVYWVSDCDYYNYDHKTEEWEDFYQLEAGSWFEINTNYDTGSHTDINELEPEQEEYWVPAPYGLGIDINDIQISDTDIAKSFNPNFVLIEDGWLLINPYSDEVLVSILGEQSINDYTGSEQTISGYTIESDNILYSTDNIDFQGTAEVSGVEPGVYPMELSQRDFINTNHNFSFITIWVTDGYLQINNIDSEQSAEGAISSVKVYDGTPLIVEDPVDEKGGSTIKRDVRPDPEPWQYDVVEISRENVGFTEFEVVMTSTGSNDESYSNGYIVIEPLNIQIISRSGSWIYDGQSHTLDEYDIKILNANISEENRIQINEYLSNHLVVNNFASIEDPGNIVNSFSAYVDDTAYELNGEFFDNGTGLDVANVIITTSFGTLTIYEKDHIDIIGHNQIITYDGHSHTLTGYDIEPYMYIPLYPGFKYEETVDCVKVGEYDMGLTLENFNLPLNVAVDNFEDGKLTIIQRPLIFKTFSDTKWSDDDNPIAYNPRYNVIGLADTDHIEITGTWLSQEEPGITSNEISFTIHNQNNEDVTDQYDINYQYGVLIVRQASDADMYYRIMGISKEPISNDDKVEIVGLKHIDGLVRKVDEDRFYPILHKLTPVDGIVTSNDIICIIPKFKHSKKIEDVTWVFENKSTGNKIFSKLHNRVLSPNGNYAGFYNQYKNIGGLSDTPILNIIPKDLEPGYYDIILNYRISKKLYSQKFSSAFLIQKP